MNPPQDGATPNRNKLPRVAAIVVTWNSNAHIEPCLGAIAAQTVAFAKVFVVDNASPQGMGDPSWGGAASFSFIRLETNTGFAAANNLAVMLCQDCEWIALINPDACVHPDWLANMLEAAERNPSAASLSSRLLLASDPSLLDGAGDAVHVSGLAWRIGHGRGVPASSLERSVFSACAAAALYRRNAFIQVGGFDESFFCYMEDVDLGFRLRLAGWQCVNIPTAIALHVGGGSSGGRRSSFSVYHGHRNLVWAYVKNMPGALFWLFLPVHVFVNLLAIGIFSCRGLGGVVCKAKWHAILELPKIWRLRRSIQRKRTASIAEIWHSLNKQIFPLR